LDPIEIRRYIRSPERLRCQRHLEWGPWRARPIGQLTDIQEFIDLDRVFHGRRGNDESFHCRPSYESGHHYSVDDGIAPHRRDWLRFSGPVMSKEAPFHTALFALVGCHFESGITG